MSLIRTVTSEFRLQLLLESVSPAANIFLKNELLSRIF